MGVTEQWVVKMFRASRFQTSNNNYHENNNKNNYNLIHLYLNLISSTLIQ